MLDANVVDNFSLGFDNGSLGDTKVYVISTGRDPVLFPELSETLVDATDSADFIRLNAIILKACQPDRARRYASAADMAEALRNAEELMVGARQTQS